jgi:hypothetical protein
MNKSFSKLAALVLAGLAAMPAWCLAAEAASPASPAQSAPQVLDVALARGGLLQGQVIDTKGAAMKAVPVSIWFENHQVATTVSDDQGRFSVNGLRGGVHQVAAGQGGSTYRLWTAEVAPPTAQTGTVAVPGQAVIRGQNGNPVGNILTSPVLWGGVMYTVGHVVGFNSGIDRTPSSP